MQMCVYTTGAYTYIVRRANYHKKEGKQYWQSGDLDNQCKYNDKNNKASWNTVDGAEQQD